MARAHSQEVKRGNELQKQLAAASRKDADHEENLDLEAAKREHAAEREKWAKERAVMARQLSAEAKRGNDLERQLALATSRKGGDAEELAAVKKKLFAANAEAKKTEARFNAQESRHRLELREREVATLRASNDADRRAAEATARALEAEGAVDVTTLRPRNVDLCDAMVLASARSQRHLRALADALLVEAKRRPGPRPRAEGHQRGAGDDWVCVDLDRVVVQLLSEEARERLGLEDLHTGSWDPQLDDIEDVPWRNYVEGEPLPPDR